MFFSTLVAPAAAALAILSSITAASPIDKRAGPCSSFSTSFSKYDPPSDFLYTIRDIVPIAGSVISPTGGTIVPATQGYPTAKIHVSLYFRTCKELVSNIHSCAVPVQARIP